MLTHSHAFRISFFFLHTSSPFFLLRLPSSSFVSFQVGVANDMYDFLQQFMKAHSKYAALPFYAVGESYAGHYVPAVTHKIWQNNNALPAGAIKINLKGTSVGNGLTDPSIQYKYVGEGKRERGEGEREKENRGTSPVCVGEFVVRMR